MTISKYAHSVKNPHIIHFVKRGRYICKGCCSITKVKSTNDWKKVTCKNCKKLEKQGERK